MKLWVRCKFRRWKVGFLGVVEAVVVVVVRGAAAGVAVVVVVHLRWLGLEIAGASPGLPNCSPFASIKVCLNNTSRRHVIRAKRLVEILSCRVLLRILGFCISHWSWD